MDVLSCLRVPFVYKVRQVCQASLPSPPGIRCPFGYATTLTNLSFTHIYTGTIATMSFEGETSVFFAAPLVGEVNARTRRFDT